jgi:SAM-dependent methyltransferase
MSRFEAMYEGTPPWDIGRPQQAFRGLADAGEINPPVLDSGCGTGEHTLLVAERGMEVLGIDVAPAAVELARAKAAERGLDAVFEVGNVLELGRLGRTFATVIDCGVFHVFDDAADRARFAERVAEALRVGGRWLSLAGSTEGPARDHGPPRRSARDLVGAAEPHLAIVGLRASEFSDDLPSTVLAWVLLARRREIPAQPSARRVAEL